MRNEKAMTDKAPIPVNMQHRPRQRGMAVPWGATIDPRGVAHFALNNADRTVQSIVQDRCFLCGKPHYWKRWFIGGCQAAFHPNGAYMDPPTHRDCMRYAVQTCPYIAAPSYAREVAQAKAKAAGIGDHVIVLENAQPGRPPGDLFVAVEAIAQDVVGPGYVKPRMPYRSLEFWRYGKNIPALEAFKLIEQHAPDLVKYIANMRGDL